MPDDSDMGRTAGVRTKRRRALDKAGPGNEAATEFFLSGGDPLAGATVDLPSGVVLGRFEVIQRLGGGHGSAVFLANDRVRVEQVALKVVEDGPCAAPAAARRLRREMALHSTIADHRFVIQAYDLHEVTIGGGHLLMLSMEYADGGSLRQWLADHRGNVEHRRSEGLQHLKGVCCGVGALHESGILHLDLKPENFLFAEGVLKVADLGLGLLMDRAPADTPDGCEPCTVHAGTAAYMSPEQLRKRPPRVLDVRADIYALCVVLYELMHARGERPFHGSDNDLRACHLRTPAPALLDIDSAVTNAVARGLKKAPSERYEDIWQFLDALEGRVEAKQIETSGNSELWLQTRNFMERGDLNSALRHCRELLDAVPNHREGRKLLAEIEARYQQAERLYTVVAEEIAQRSLAESEALVKQAVTLYKEHPAGEVVQQRLWARAREYSQHLLRAKTALNRGYWEAALTRLQQAQALDPGGGGVAEAVEFVTKILAHVRYVRGQIDRAVNEGKQRQAIGLARALDRYNARMREVVGQS